MASVDAGVNVIYPSMGFDWEKVTGRSVLEVVERLARAAALMRTFGPMCGSGDGSEARGDLKWEPVVSGISMKQPVSIVLSKSRAKAVEAMAAAGDGCSRGLPMARPRSEGQIRSRALSR